MNNSVFITKSGKEYKITSPYGLRDIPELNMFNNYHIGVDYATPQGTPLIVPQNSTVLKVGNWGDYGGHVFVYLPELDKTLLYAHLSRIDVKQGQMLKAGTMVGLSGGAKGTVGAGTSTGAHTHFGCAKGKITSFAKGLMNQIWIDPESVELKPKKEYLLLPKEDATWCVYKENETKPVVGNEVGFILPKKFGGLEYEVLGHKKNDPNIVYIQTRDFGKVQIFIGKGTGAKLVKR